jgi:hypothetical protein
MYNKITRAGLMTPKVTVSNENNKKCTCPDLNRKLNPWLLLEICIHEYCI